MRMYRIQRTDTGAWVRHHSDDPQKMAMTPDGTPRWTLSHRRALVWTKRGGADGWIAWWNALWKASEQDPPCECQVDEYEDPAATIGGEDD